MTDNQETTPATVPLPAELSVLWYSQTGQAVEAAKALLAPLEKAGTRIQWVRIAPEHNFPFPWKFSRFAGIFPQAVDPRGSVPVRLEENPTAPLVILAVPVWFLAPAIPLRSLLLTKPETVTGRDVIALVACRNVWYSAALQIARLVTAAEGHYVGTIAATDTHPPLVSAITTMRWLLTGHREQRWPLPPAGITDTELERLTDLGRRLVSDGVSAIAAADAAPVDPPMAITDLVMGPVFRGLGTVIRTSRPGSRLRRAQLVGAGAVIVTAVLTAPPMAAVARLLFPGPVDGWLQRSLAEAVTAYRKPRSDRAIPAN
ncbi:hypothetical protein [Streptomyces sp. NPDC004435]|uniref:hypothetical protein n=1 Tax=Streptomyces sp. NPDC004435 TaxID=3364701 RepID=UPI0036ACF06C